MQTETETGPDTRKLKKIDDRIKDENIRYIRRYISDIGDVRHDIGDISVFDRYIVEISGLWHIRVLV